MSIKQKYLIIPSVPTPNGRLHLGHIGGPFLTADVLARALKRQGHEVKMCCGTDSYESFVLREAAKKNQSAEEICHHYHGQIAKDLKRMAIDIDTFINPLSDDCHQRYVNWQYTIFSK